MDDALKELTSTKFWILNFVTIALSILATFITDWLKKFINANVNKVISRINLSPSWSRRSFTFFYLYLILLSYFSMTINHQYWQPFFMAFFFALESMISVKKAYEAEQSADDANTRKAIRYVASTMYLRTYMLLWGVPRLTYHATEFHYITPIQATAILIIAFTNLWVIARKKSIINESLQAADN